MNKYASFLLFLAVSAPVSLFGQAYTTFSSYVAADGGVSGGPLLVGGSVGAEAARLGIRLGAAADPGLTSPSDAIAEQSGVWSAEADVLLYLEDPRGDATFVPYLVAGSGLRSFRGAEGAPVAGMLSYGAGMRVPVLGGLALEGEARYRQPLAEGPEFVPDGISSGFELRFGLSFRSAGTRRDTRPAAPLAPRALPLPSSRPASGSAEAAARLAIARRALDSGDDHLGVRYTWGGNTPSSGFDCSGFIRYVYRQHGVELPRVSRDQARTGVALPLDLAALEPGDLMAFASKGDRIDHIAIYAGEGRILHSSSSGGGVRYDDLLTQRGSWYLRHWVAARRVIPSSLFTQ